MDREPDWTAGYVTEIEYTHGYYRELSPALLSSCLCERWHRSTFNEIVEISRAWVRPRAFD